MIYADTAAEIETRRKAFLRKWRLKCRAVADSLEEAGDRLFTFTRLDPSQWKSARTTNAIERLNGEFPPPHQDPDRAALRRDRAHAALGAARLRPDPDAQGRMAGKPCLSPSNPCLLTSPPEKPKDHMPGDGRQEISTAFATRPERRSQTRYPPRNSAVAKDRPCGRAGG